MANSKTLNTRLVLARDSKTNWAQNNPVLLLGEIGIEFDPDHLTNSYTVRAKVGDGTTVWNNLPYLSDGGSVVLPVADGSSIVDDDNVWSISGFGAAAANSYPIKNASGAIEWKTIPEDLTARVVALESAIREKANSADVYTRDQLYTQDEIDNMFSTQATGLDWKESVATFSDIATTYPNPEDGWTVNVKDTDYTYRFDGEKWVAISANAIPKATTSVDGLMTKEMVEKLESIENGADENVIETVATPDGDLPVSEKKVIVPTATASKLGLTKGSTANDAVGVGTDGTMTVNSLSTDKLYQGNDILVLDGGTSDK